MVMMSCIKQLLVHETTIILMILAWNRHLAAPASLARPNCTDKCGNVSVPFPFGIGPGCFWYDKYEMVCEPPPPDSYSPSRLTMKSLPAELEVLDISLLGFTMTFAYPVKLIRSGLLDTLRNNSLFKHFDRDDSDIFVNFAWDWKMISYNDSPSLGINCTSNSIEDCYGVASTTNFTISGGFCLGGYQGNPFLVDGCEDINECEINSIKQSCPYCRNLRGSYVCGPRLHSQPVARWNGRPIVLGIGSYLGTLISFIFLWRLYKIIKKRREMKLKQKYFKQNGGLLLQKQLSSSEDNVEKSKLFNSKELEKATDHFNDDRILGRGGQGTVYKGMLTDGRIVAVKKLKSIDEGNIESFINEVFILTNINHRNVVKLLGCCLETEVPLLVYEYIPNGTLYQYIHSKNEEFQLTWEIRLRIAAEVAGALSYLHSAASIPIYHRDIKSTNILLDDKYRAKVADFGTSKSMALDQTHLTTQVQGTFGYLDPEYFQSSKFTDKSDVYSFGIVLVELLTGKKPVSSSESNEEITYRGLAAYFIDCFKEDQLFGIVDDHVGSQAIEEEITAFANLARRCLSLSGKRRPTMKEVAQKLESIRKLSRQHSDDHSSQVSVDDDDDNVDDFCGSERVGNLDIALTTSPQTSITIDVSPLTTDTKPLVYSW